MLEAKWNSDKRELGIHADGVLVASISGPTAPRIWLTAQQMARFDSKSGTRQADYLSGIIDLLMVGAEAGEIRMEIAE